MALEDSDFYRYRARIVRVVDGDTVDLDVDLGFRVRHRVRVRLLGINAPESAGPGASAAGKDAKAFLISRLGVAGLDVHLETHLDATDKYGRLLGKIWLKGIDRTINEEMVALGYAKPYDGHGPRT